MQVTVGSGQLCVGERGLQNGGWDSTGFEVFSTWDIQVLVLLKRGDRKKFPPLQRGEGRKLYQVNILSSTFPSKAFVTSKIWVFTSKTDPSPSVLYIPTTCICQMRVPTWGLVTNYGEGGWLQNEREGTCEFLPLRKEGGKSFGVVFTR